MGALSKFILPKKPLTLYYERHYSYSSGFEGVTVPFGSFDRLERKPSGLLANFHSPIVIPQKTMYNKPIINSGGGI